MHRLTQVGWGRLTGSPNIQHALLWVGSAGSFTDLNQYLPVNFTSAEADGQTLQCDYGAFLGRAPDAASLQMWLSAMAGGRMTQASVTEIIRPPAMAESHI